MRTLSRNPLADGGCLFDEAPQPRSPRDSGAQRWGVTAISVFWAARWSEETPDGSFRGLAMLETEATQPGGRCTVLCVLRGAKSPKYPVGSGKLVIQRLQRGVPVSWPDGVR